MQSKKYRSQYFRLLAFLIFSLTISTWSFSVVSHAITIEVDVTPPVITTDTPPPSEPPVVDQVNPTTQPSTQPSQGTGTIPQPTPKPTPIPVVPVTPKPTIQEPLPTPTISQRISDFRNNPEVKRFAAHTITPTAVGASVFTLGITGITVASSTADILPLLNYLFNALINIFGIKKKKNIKRWGTVYDAQTKNPVELSIVRLIDAATRTIVQTAVTDEKGRFYFEPKAGSYLISASKPTLQFPSTLTQGLINDGTYTKLYFGEQIRTSGEVSFNQSVPLDPISSHIAAPRIKDAIRSFLEKISYPVLVFGFMMGLFALWVNPDIVNAILCVMYILLFILKRALSEKPIKPLGYIFDINTHKPIIGLVIRIFDKKYNKLLATKITDKNGSFNALLPDGEYYLKVMSYNYRFASNTKDSDHYDGGTFSVVNESTPKLQIPLTHGTSLQSTATPQVTQKKQEKNLQDASIFDYLDAHNKKLSDIAGGI
ncbi:MAG: hypothetical protein WC045_03090 [Patescibacteria group bacterium]